MMQNTRKRIQQKKIGQTDVVDVWDAGIYSDYNYSWN
jgi:hypothetical protein